MPTAYLSLGSNLDDPIQQVQTALRTLDNHEHLNLVCFSSLYKTPAWGLEEQTDFVNACCEIQTEFSPLALLGELQKLETKQQRVRKVRWGPRTIDIDIIDYDSLSLDDPRLQLPHIHCTDRAFVLVPLQEIAPSIYLQEKHIAEWLKRLDTESIQIIS